MANVVTTLDHTFADEWQLPDLILSPSEVSTARLAAERLGLNLHYTPTGRTVQMILRAALDLAVYNEAAARTPAEKLQWRAAAIRAKAAMGQQSFN